MERETNNNNRSSGLSGLLKGISIGVGIGAAIGTAILGYMVIWKLDKKWKVLNVLSN